MNAAIKRRFSMWGLVVIMLLAFTINLKVKGDVEMWPLLELTDDGTTVCYPFYTNEGDFKMILNFYAKTNNGKDTHIFWPFVKFSGNRLVRVAPFWFNENPDEYTLFPFIKQTKESTLWTIPPVYTRKDGSFNAVFPFYIKSRNSLYIFPDIYMKESRKRVETNVIPFYSHSYSKDKSDTKESLNFLNYLYVNDKRSERTLFLPFYGNEKAKNGGNDVLWVMPYMKETNKKNNLVRHTVFPCFSTQKSDKEDYFWLLNYYQSKSAEKDEFKVYPFIGTETEKVSDTRTAHKLWVLWPFYSKDCVTDGSGREVSYNKQFLGFSNTKSESGTRTFSIFGFVVREKVD